MQTKTNFQKKREEGLRLKKLHDAEMVPYGDRGEMKPRSLGTTYDIPPDDGTYCEDMVDQQGADLVDINRIMKRIDPSGQMFNKALKSGMQTAPGMFYGDFTDAKTFDDAMQIVAHAEEQFATLDGELRARFDNNPIKFLEYIHDPKKLEEQYTLGLRLRPTPTEPETTLKDVVTAVRESSKKEKPAGKGGNSDG